MSYVNLLTYRPARRHLVSEISVADGLWFDVAAGDGDDFLQAANTTFGRARSICAHIDRQPARSLRPSPRVQASHLRPAGGESASAIGKQAKSLGMMFGLR